MRAAALWAVLGVLALPVTPAAPAPETAPPSELEARCDDFAAAFPV